MSSKRLFSWSKRQSTAEPYYKTGGLLPIDTLGPESSNDTEAKDTHKARRRPSKLIIVPPDHQQFTSSPLSSPHNAALVSSTPNLMTVFNDMLRSPAVSAAACPRSGSVHKPLPTRPPPSPVSSTPDLPVELPGSLLQRNQGFPRLDSSDSVPSRPTSQNVRRVTHPPDSCIEDEVDILDLLHLFPEPLYHSKSVPSLNIGYCEGAMKASRAGTAPNAGSKPKPYKMHHRKALSDIEWRTLANPHTAHDSTVATGDAATHSNASNNSNRSRTESSDLWQPSPPILEAAIRDSAPDRRASRRDDPCAALPLTPRPATTRGQDTKELETIIATQDLTIARLQSQFGSLRASHETHVSSLADAHAAEVASLRNYAKALEEQLAQRPLSPHHNVTTSADPHLASSNNLPFLLDSSTPSRESSQHTTNTSASSTVSHRSGSEKQLYSEESPDMESLKRKLSTTRRPQTADRNLLPELNQYKQNNVALQTQIGSLMAKLNESKKGEKALRIDLEEAEQRLAESESKAGEAQQLVSNVQALQNTIDHLESRLEVANTEKLDAQEELFNMRALKSPFDAQFPELQLSQDAHMSMDTVFSGDSPSGRQRDSSSLNAHMERLQEEIRHKDAYIFNLEEDGAHLRHMLEQVSQKCDEFNLQLDIQNELLGKTRKTDEHIEQLRAAIVDREAVIGEKEKSVRAVERQLEHHKLLLQAEIRKHATTARYLTGNDPLPELTALATKKDIDRWIRKLNQRLQKEQPMSPSREPGAATDHVEDLRNEIDFYVREIIYYKLDIRGYKSDIKKLNRITAQLGSYGNRASDLDSDTSSLRPAPTPNRARFLSTTPELKGTFPAVNGAATANIGSARALTPPTTADPSRLVEGAGDYEEALARVPTTPYTPTKVTILATHDFFADLSERQDTQHPNTPNDDAVGISERRPVGQVNSIDEATNVERPTLERDISNASTVRPIIPTSRFSKDTTAATAPPPLSQNHKTHSRVTSASSTTSSTLHATGRTDRRRSSTASTGIPFVIAMGSPHNPAIAVAAKNMPVARPLRSGSGGGVGGTMASSTPLSSPTSIPAAAPPFTAEISIPQFPAAQPGHKRKLSLGFRKQDVENPMTPPRFRSGHARSASAGSAGSRGSIRTAIRWSRRGSVKAGRENSVEEKDKEREVQVRKDSIGSPQPLGSPFQMGESPAVESEVVR